MNVSVRSAVEMGHTIHFVPPLTSLVQILTAGLSLCFNPVYTLNKGVPFQSDLFSFTSRCLEMDGLGGRMDLSGGQIDGFSLFALVSEENTGCHCSHYFESCLHPKVSCGILGASGLDRGLIGLTSMKLMLNYNKIVCLNTS